MRIEGTRNSGRLVGSKVITHEPGLCVPGLVVWPENCSLRGKELVPSFQLGFNYCGGEIGFGRAGGVREYATSWSLAGWWTPHPTGSCSGWPLPISQRRGSLLEPLGAPSSPTVLGGELDVSVFLTQRWVLSADLGPTGLGNTYHNTKGVPVFLRQSAISL